MSNNRPKAIFYCGANGSGKSTLRQFNQDRVSLVIDSDHIAAEINPEMPRLADMEAGKTALRLFRQALDNQISFSMESTLSGKSALTRIQTANAAGFYVILNYIGLATPELNIRRMQERVASGGHWIAPELILMAICGTEISRRSLFTLNVTLASGIISANGTHACLSSCLKAGNASVLTPIASRLSVVKQAAIPFSGVISTKLTLRVSTIV